MCTAIIDLGTNTFHLLIAEITGSKFKILYKTNVPVKLGEGRINDNIIIQPAFNRGIEALKQFRKTIIELQATQIQAMATSAVRSALNGHDFIQAAKEQAHINIKIITGDEEAELIYQGVKLSQAITEKSLIMDIGGGSVEFILCDTEKLIWKKSYAIGAARLMQQFFKSDPMSDEDRNAILTHIKVQLTDLIEICKIHQPKALVGAAGAFETFAQLIINEKKLSTDIKQLKTYDFDYNEYTDITHKLISATHHQRKSMPGMIALRVDMSAIAALLTNYVTGSLKIEKLILSTYDLKMGALSSNLQH